MVFASLPWREYNKKIFFERDYLHVHRPLLCYAGQTIPRNKSIMQSFIPTQARVLDHGIAFSRQTVNPKTNEVGELFQWVTPDHPEYDVFLQVANNINGEA